MHRFAIAAVMALAFATAASAAPGFHQDAKGACHRPDGRLARIEFCQTKHCHDPKTGRLANCVTLRCPLPACCWDNCSVGGKHRTTRDPTHH